MTAPWAASKSALARVRALLTAGVAGQVVGVLAIPVLTRLYSESEFGSLALLSSVLAIITPVAALRFEVAVPLPEDDSDASDVFSLAAAIVCVVSTVSMVVAAVVVGFLPDMTVRGGAVWVAAMFVNLLLSGLYLIGITWLIRREAFKRIAVVGAVQAVSQALAYIAVGLVLPSTTGLFIALTIGNVVGASAVARSVATLPSPPTPRADRTAMRASWTRYRRFAFVSSPASFLNTFSVELPFLVLASVVTKATYGVLSVARRLTQAPISLLAQAVGQVFFGASARFRRDRSSVVTRSLIGLVSAMTAVSAVALLLYLFVVPPILDAVFDEGWEQTGRFVQLLSFGFLAQGISAATTPVVDVAQRQELQLVREAVRLLTTGLTAIWVFRSVDSAETAVVAFSIVGVVNALVAIVISLIAARDIDRSVQADQVVDAPAQGA